MYMYDDNRKHKMIKIHLKFHRSHSTENYTWLKVTGTSRIHGEARTNKSSRKDPTQGLKNIPDPQRNVSTNAITTK